MANAPDLTNLRWFFDHLELRDADAADFARQLVHRQDGWEITAFAGPEQMDVWQLVVSRGDWSVRFGVERGRSDGIIARGPDGGRWVLASIAQARDWWGATG